MSVPVGHDTVRALEQFKYPLDRAAIVAITDQCGMITDVNDKLCEISNYSRKELLGQDHRLVSSGYRPASFNRELWRAIGQAACGGARFAVAPKTGRSVGSIRPSSRCSTRLGNQVNISPFSDITERNHVEARLREQASLAKPGELAAIVAHEVRNPIAEYEDRVGGGTVAVVTLLIARRRA